MKVCKLIEKLEQLDPNADVKLQIDDRLHDIETRCNCEGLTGEQYFDRLNGHLVTEIVLEGIKTFK